MASFYFHIRDADQLIVDEDGLDLPSLDQALIEGHRGVADMLLEAERAGDDISDQVMEITDASGRVLSVLPLREL